MSRTTVALLVGLILGLSAAFGTFSSFVIVLLFGTIGLLVGMILDGKIDLRRVLGRGSENR